MILILRNPVERAYSNWNMRYNDKRIIKHGLMFNSNYNNVLKKLDFDYLADFYLCNSDNHQMIFQKPLDIFHKSRYFEQVKSLMKYFEKEQLKIIIYERMIKNLENTIFEIFRFLNVDELQPSKITPHNVAVYNNRINERTKSRLKEFFDEHNKKLFQLIGVDIPEWNN
jgi:hypothetical protein